MEKSPEAFRTISEVADTLDVPTHVLRFWESRFPQVKPVKRGGGRRYYRPEDVRLLRGIRGLLYDDGMTIKGVQKILRERGVRHVIALGAAPEGEAVSAAESGGLGLSSASPASASFSDGPAAASVRSESDGSEPAPSQEAAMADMPRPIVSPEAAAPGEAPRRPHVPDREALRALLDKLQALRAVMVDDDA